MIVKAIPRVDSDGTTITYLDDCIGKEPIVYTYETPQENLKILNKGYVDIIFSVNGNEVTLGPNGTWEKDIDFTELTIRTKKETCEIEITVKEFSNKLVKRKDIKGKGGTSLEKLATFSIPYKNENGDLVDSGFKINENIIVSSKDLELPPNTLHLGTNVSLHENGGFVEYHTNSLDKNYILLDYENDLEKGSSEPIYWKRDPLERNVIIQADDTKVLNNVTEFRVSSEHDAELSKLYINISDIAEAPNNVRFCIVVNGTPIAHYPSKSAFESPMDDTGLGLSHGINEIELKPHFSFLKDYGTIEFRLVNDGPKGDIPINLMGNGTLPYMACDRNIITATPIGGDSKNIIKYFGDRMRIKVNKEIFGFEKLINDEEGQEVWKPFSAIDSRRILTKSLYLIDDEVNKERPLRLVLHTSRVELKDNEGNIINPECDIPTFEIKALDGSCGVCLVSRDRPIFVKSNGIIEELALKEDIANADLSNCYQIKKAETKDFDTAFSSNDRYRCFNMEENLPPSYTKGDNDFWADCYWTTDTRFYKIILHDVRSNVVLERTRKFDKWDDWVIAIDKEYVDSKIGNASGLLDLTKGENINVVYNVISPVINVDSPAIDFGKVSVPLEDVKTKNFNSAYDCIADVTVRIIGAFQYSSIVGLTLNGQSIVEGLNKGITLIKGINAYTQTIKFGGVLVNGNYPQCWSAEIYLTIQPYPIDTQPLFKDSYLNPIFIKK